MSEEVEWNVCVSIFVLVTWRKFIIYTIKEPTCIWFVSLTNSYTLQNATLQLPPKQFSILSKSLIHFMIYIEFYCSVHYS